MLSTQQREIEIAKRLYRRNKKHIIVMSSDWADVYNVFAAVHRKDFEDSGYVCVYDTRDTVMFDG